MTDFDALLLVSFGGPEGMDDVIPFLENVLRGRNVPRERMLSVAKHYELFGGVSPINQQNRDLIAALEKEFERAGLRLPIYWGNRNWHPLLPETLRQMTANPSSSCTCTPCGWMHTRGQTAARAVCPPSKTGRARRDDAGRARRP